MPTMKLVPKLLPLQILNIKFEAGAVEAGDASRYGSGCGFSKMMRAPCGFTALFFVTYRTLFGCQNMYWYCTHITAACAGMQLIIKFSQICSWNCRILSKEHIR
jgi:hypothetical protein